MAVANDATLVLHCFLRSFKKLTASSSFVLSPFLIAKISLASATFVRSWPIFKATDGNLIESPFSAHPEACRLACTRQSKYPGTKNSDMEASLFPVLSLH